MQTLKMFFGTIFICFVVTLFAQTAFGACYVAADLSCSDKYGRNVLLAQNWRERPVIIRSRLLISSEVQSSKESCVRFAQILHHECQLNKPLQSLFVDSSGVKNSVFVVAGGEDLYEKRETLKAPFKDYFNYDFATNWVFENIGAMLELGTAAQAALRAFLLPTNDKDVLNIPQSCRVGDTYSVCGVILDCLPGRDPNLGETIRVTKSGLGAASASQWCSDNEIAAKVVSVLKTFITNGFIDNKNSVPFEIKPIPKFSAFAKMPVVNQVGGYIQGLTLDKYGQNFAMPGICMPTAHAILAMALKGETPLAVLGNKFDSADPVQIQNVRSKGSTTVSTRLRYREYAVHIDEMMRASGLKYGFWKSFKDFNGVFYGANSVERPAVYVSSVVGNDVFDFTRDHAATAYTQKTVENNFKTWVANRQGMVLALQSSASQPPPGQKRPITGHAVAVQGYSTVSGMGDVMVISDPWGVVSHLQFSDFTYPDAGKEIARYPIPSYQSCVSSRQANCGAAVDRCIDQIVGVRAPNVTVVTGGLCSFSGNPATQDWNAFRTRLLVACIASAPTSCPQHYTQTRPNGAFRMLNQVGASPGYIGGFSANSTKTAAYVTGYLKASPWPYHLTKQQVRAITPFTATLTAVNSQATATNSATSSCNGLTKGTIAIAGKTYTFLNPIPRVLGSITAYTEATNKVVTVPCTNLKIAFSNGEYSPQTYDFLGTYDLACSAGKLVVSDNQCGEAAKAKACTIANGEGVQYPKSNYTNGMASYSEFETCQVTSCKSGFSKAGNTCQCLGKNSADGALLSGGRISFGQCTGVLESCPKYFIKSPASQPGEVACVYVERSCGLGRNQLYSISPQKKPFATFADRLSSYQFDNQGYCVWKNCQLPDIMTSTVNATTGSKTCSLNANVTTAIEQSKSQAPNGRCLTGHVKDYEGKFCADVTSPCQYGVGAIGMMTYDLRSYSSVSSVSKTLSGSKCLFMGCLPGYRAVKWTAPGYTYSNVNVLYNEDQSNVHGYHCTKEPDVVDLPGIGLGKIDSSGNKYLYLSLQSMLAEYAHTEDLRSDALPYLLINPNSRCQKYSEVGLAIGAIR